MEANESRQRERVDKEPKTSEKAYSREGKIMPSILTILVIAYIMLIAAGIEADKK